MDSVFCVSESRATLADFGAFGVVATAFVYWCAGAFPALLCGSTRNLYSRFGSAWYVYAVTSPPQSSASSYSPSSMDTSTYTPSYGRASVVLLRHVTSTVPLLRRTATWLMTLLGFHVGTSGLYHASTELL